MQILRPPGHVAGGSIRFRGEELLGLDPEELRRFRWRNVSLVFQSAMSSLNPVTRVGDQFVDMFKAHEKIRKNEALERSGDLLELVGIDRRRLRAYPHELSGGMRQRVIIAMALALQPELLLMDEPTTALDVVVQREILEEIQQLQRELGFAVLFITHDLSLLVELSDRIAIMYAGDIVELAPADELLRQPPASLHGGADGLVPAALGRAGRDDGHSRLAARSRAIPRPAADSIRAARLRTMRAARIDVPALRPLSVGRTAACHLAGDYR